jgi:hypothetical protein
VPIRNEERARYPRDWRSISKAIRFERAKGRCECAGVCGYDHGGRCGAKHGREHPVTDSRVVLTVAHLNHTPEDCRPENLVAMCQRCHLAYDREHHAKTRRTADARLAEQHGQMRLREVPRG